MGRLWSIRSRRGGDSLTLTQISTTTDWTAIKCTTSHTLLERPNQTVWGFGEGQFGKLATGTDAGYSTPSQLLPDSVWVQTAPGSNTSFFRKNDGSIWGCGQNGNGNLGIGNNTLGVYPLTQAGVATDWRSIEPSSVHTMALKNNGTLWSCGLNTSGQLGIGSTVGTNVFVQVGTASDWAKVRCGRLHTLALNTNGTLWAWGDNTYGQLGDGTTTNRLVPTQIGSICTLEVNEFTPKVMQLLTNPVDSQVQLSFTYDGVKQLSVFNTQGQEVLTYNVSQDYTSFDVSGYAAGVYFIKCKFEGTEQTVKFVKE